jgi:hypothetical protein
MLDLVPQFNEELKVRPHRRVLRSPKGSEALREFPSLLITVHNLKMSAIALLSVKGLGTALKEDCMEQGSPCDAHQNNVAARPEPCAGTVIRLDGKKRTIARLFDMNGHFVCKPRHVDVLLTSRVAPIRAQSKPFFRVTI